MKTKKRVLLVAFMISVVGSINAQIFKIEVNSISSIVIGDIKSRDFNSENSAYLSGAYGGNLSFVYYLKNSMGFGIKESYLAYQMDKEKYQNDLINNLAIANSNYSITQPSTYLSYNTMLGMSYRIKVSNKFIVEPYFYLGAQVFSAPFVRVYYVQHNGIIDKTYIYNKKTKIFYGGLVTPGAQFHWNITNHIGLSISAEYQGGFLDSDSEEEIKYSYNSLEINYINKKYNPQSVNLLLGLSFSFGKGTKVN